MDDLRDMSELLPRTRHVNLMNVSPLDLGTMLK